MGLGEGSLEFMKDDRGMLELAAVVEAVYRNWADRFVRLGPLDTLYPEVEIFLGSCLSFFERAQSSGSATVEPEMAKPFFPMRRTSSIWSGPGTKP
jgi:hypothetical protein